MLTKLLRLGKITKYGFKGNNCISQFKATPARLSTFTPRYTVGVLKRLKMP